MNELRKKLSELLPSGPKRSGSTPGLKVPAFASDIYWDLRQRHLLPFALLLIVAVAAVPFVLGDSGESEEEAPLPPIASSSAANAREVVVTETQQGLRSYRKRLRNRQPTNPFKPQYTGAPAADADQGESPTLEEGSVEATPPEESSGGGVPIDGGGTGEVPSGQPSGEIRYFTYAIDVRIVPVSSNGVPSKAEPFVRRDLPELTMLPARKAPALVFLQPSADEEKALMLVNPNVKGLFGEGVCVSGGETCQLLALKKGLPQTVVYGGNERIFRIELLDIHLVETDRLKKAPLGSEKDG
jgi:hypothetical protein